jgi:hypothetical protein
MLHNAALLASTNAGPAWHRQVCCCYPMCMQGGTKAAVSIGCAQAGRQCTAAYMRCAVSPAAGATGSGNLLQGTKLPLQRPRRIQRELLLGRPAAGVAYRPAVLPMGLCCCASCQHHQAAVCLPVRRSKWAYVADVALQRSVPPQDSSTCAVGQQLCHASPSHLRALHTHCGLVALLPAAAS